MKIALKAHLNSQTKEIKSFVCWYGGKSLKVCLRETTTF